MKLFSSMETEAAVTEPSSSSLAPSPAHPLASGLMSEEEEVEMEGGYAETRLADLAIDPATRSDLCLEEKRKIVHTISQWPKDAYAFLHGWTRRELLQLICAELGKKRKYTGLTKPKMIERLLKLVSLKNSLKKQDDSIPDPSLSDRANCTAKKKRKIDPPHPPVALAPSNGNETEREDAQFCQNLACQATLGSDDAFCKRCSCCICYCYDDNKDPSLWLVCSSDPPFQGVSCGLSCHLECALKDERTGIVRTSCHERLDGEFYCICCKKVNGMMGSLRKQLSIAKDARRVDVLCHRVSLGDQMLKGTERFRDIQTVVQKAAKKLMKEVGPLNKVSAVMARGIVNRLSCGAEVQKLCSMAIGAIDLVLPGLPIPLAIANTKIPGSASCRIKFEDVSPVSVVISLATEPRLYENAVIGYRLWHRRSCVADYAEESTCVLLRPNTRIMISGLSPSSEYRFKVTPFSSSGELGTWETTMTTKAANFDPLVELEGSNEEVVRSEQHAMTQTNSQRGSTSSSDSLQETRHHALKSHSKVLLEGIADNGMKHSPSTIDEPFGRPNSAPMETPTKSDAPNNNMLDSGDKSESAESQYEYCVKVIRWLECEGLMEKEFRIKFLTWFSLRATMQERRVVSAFIDVLIDEPASLVDQLADAFMDGICGKEKVADVCNVKPTVKNRLCTRLWH